MQIFSHIAKGALCSGSLVLCAVSISATRAEAFDANITVGILHSLTGTMAISESTLVDTLAIDEINAAGGVEVDGKKYKILYKVEDGASDWPTFAEKSKEADRPGPGPRRLRWLDLRQPQGDAAGVRIQGRLPLLPDSVRGSGVFNNIFYTGATPNQQSEPATKFM